MKAAGADIATAAMAVWDVETWLVSSEGTRIRQRVRKCGGGMSATAVGERETQRRSHPSAFGQYGTRGYELIRSFDLPGNAERLAAEARALLTAPECPAATTDLILGSEQMALQIHESVGHAVELDRILGWEAAFAGTSWLDLEPARLAALRQRSDDHHRRRHPARRPRLVRLRRRGHARAAGRHRARRHLGRRALRPRFGRPRRAFAQRRVPCGPTAGRACRWCG